MVVIFHSYVNVYQKVVIGWIPHSMVCRTLKPIGCTGFISIVSAPKFYDYWPTTCCHRLGHITGCWLFFHILGMMDYTGLMDFNGIFHIFWMSSSQLTNSIIFQRVGKNHQPDPNLSGATFHVFVIWIISTQIIPWDPRRISHFRTSTVLEKHPQAEQTTNKSQMILTIPCTNIGMEPCFDGKMLFPFLKFA